jgi:hypothetical protein
MLSEETGTPAGFLGSAGFLSFAMFLLWERLIAEKDRLSRTIQLLPSFLI